jgi:hypothetical protein
MYMQISLSTGLFSSRSNAMQTTLEVRCHHRAKLTAWIILPIWFLVALGGSLLGVFESGQQPPILLGLMAAVPVVAYALAFAWSAEFRSFVLRANPRVLTALQIWRVIGLVFVILYYRGELPRAFALPAGWGDFAIGITAPLVAWAMASMVGPRRLIFMVWNVLGIADLVLAVTLGVLSSNSPIGILATGVTTQLMGSFPLSLIPTFLVPLFLILHLITLLRIYKKPSSAE